MLPLGSLSRRRRSRRRRRNIGEEEEEQEEEGFYNLIQLIQTRRHTPGQRCTETSEASDFPSASVYRKRYYLRATRQQVTPETLTPAYALREAVT